MSQSPARPRTSPLERNWPVAWVLAWRYLRGERSQVLSSTALAALVATGLGVMAMTIAMALMSGYTDTLQRKLIGLQGDVIASPVIRQEGGGELAQARRSLDRAAIEGITFVGEVAYGEGSISSQARPEGVSVVMRGIDSGSAPAMVGPDGAPDPDLPVPSLAAPGAAASGAAASGAASEAVAPGVPGVLLGRELMSALEVETGDTVRLVVLALGEDRARFRYRSARVVGAFSTGFAEFDSSWLLLDRQVLQEARGENGIDILEVKTIAEADRAAIADEIQALFGSDWLVQRWETLNGPLFAALELQETLLFLVLGLIVVVSTFNTSSTLIILVRERVGDIGVLGSLGLEPRQLWWIFVIYGMGLGALGTALGVGFGSTVSWVITRFELVRFDPEVAAVYFIDSVPFHVQLGDVLAIVTFSLVVTFLACSLPASKAARLTPAVALRDE